MHVFEYIYFDLLRARSVLQTRSDLKPSLHTTHPLYLVVHGGHSRQTLLALSV